MTKLEEEYGRSMVEMLGVLAIIGVLSVAGVSGYTTAMNKHKANEILNEANKRAVVLAARITVGQTIDNNSLAEFGTGKVVGSTFGVKPYTVGDKTFTLTLSDSAVASDVCAQMKNSSSPIMSINDDCSEIAFYSDFSYGDGSDSLEDEDLSVLGNECSVDTPCSVGNCTDGYCVCSDGKKACNGKCCSQNQICSSYTERGDCVSIAGCTTNSQCAENEFCHIYSKDQYTPGEGKCESIGDVKTATISGHACVSESEGETCCSGICAENDLTCKSCKLGHKYTYTDTQMTWWAAENWCLSLSKNLATRNNFEDAVGCNTVENGANDSRIFDSTCSEEAWSSLLNSLPTGNFWIKNEYYGGDKNTGCAIKNKVAGGKMFVCHSKGHGEPNSSYPRAPICE